MQFLARLKANSFAGRDADFGAGTWITTDSSFAGADTKNAKSAQFDALTGGESLFQAIKNRIYCALNLGAGKARALDYIVYDILFDQWSNLAAANRIAYITPYSIDATGFVPIVEHVNSSFLDFLSATGVF
jgi:hypothetical protein